MKEFRNSNYVNFKYAKGKTDIYGKTFHDYYELFLLLNGDVEFINNHTRQTIKPFQLFIIPPGEYHQFIVTENIENYERCVIEIHPGLIDTGILDSALEGKEVISLTDGDRITKHFLYLIDCLSAVKDSDYPYILSAVTTDIIFLIKNSTDAGKLFNENLCPLSLKLMENLNEHFSEQLDLDLLSGIFYCSVSSMCHIFKRDFGISIKKYILQKRMNASKMALQCGEKPEDVSVRYGFSNYSTFYRDYKKNFGIAPSETSNKNTL